MPDQLTHEDIKVFTDGGARGNPGPAALGVVVTTTDEQILDSFGRYLGETTNNQAEYQAVIAALEHIKQYNPRRATFHIDSELVVKQLNGQYKVKNAELKPLHERAKRLAETLEIEFVHVYREANKLADEQVNIAIDQALGLK